MMISFSSSSSTTSIVGALDDAGRVVEGACAFEDSVGLPGLGLDTVLINVFLLFLWSMTFFDADGAMSPTDVY